jgi:hypothetical protein
MVLNSSSWTAKDGLIRKIEAIIFKLMAKQKTMPKMVTVLLSASRYSMGDINGTNTTRQRRAIMSVARPIKKSEVMAFIEWRSSWSFISINVIKIDPKLSKQKPKKLFLIMVNNEIKSIDVAATDIFSANFFVGKKKMVHISENIDRNSINELVLSSCKFSINRHW